MSNVTDVVLRFFFSVFFFILIMHWPEKHCDFIVYLMCDNNKDTLGALAQCVQGLAQGARVHASVLGGVSRLKAGPEPTFA